MSPPLTYLPAYVGLFLALTLSIACNAFLDIRHGSFVIEVALWGIAFAATLWVGWRQHGQLSEDGQQKQKMALLLGGLLSILFFFPIWGLPRAGIYMLAALQVANNCVSTSRRQLHLGLLVSAVIVMFAATHPRADWTLLFYLLPYLVAVVFTLVSEQVSRRTKEVRQESLGQTSSAGQSAAIFAASAVILLLGASFYLLTPQPTWPYLHWRYGQLSNIGLLGEASGQLTGSGSASNGQQNDSSSGSGAGNAGEGEAYGQLPGSGWPTSAQMRQAAARPGMPAWQSMSMVQMADLSDALQQALAPLIKTLEEMLRDLKEWLKEHRTEALTSLFALLLLAILLAFVRLLREANMVRWLGTRFDYLRFGLLDWHAGGNRAASQYYGAMERLFSIGEMPRPVAANTREYLKQVSHFHRDLRREITELTLLFEQSRYGSQSLSAQQIDRMREIYRLIYRKAGQ